MKIAFRPLIPKRLEAASTLYALIFSDNLTYINDQKTPNGFLKTKVGTFLNPVEWTVKKARPFQGLLIIVDNEKEWISNLYFSGWGFEQGPWISSTLKQIQEKFVIHVDTTETKTPEIHIESNAPLFFKTKNKKKYENQWYFAEKTDYIKGIIDTPKEAHPLLTVENGNGFGTSISIELNKKRTLKNKEIKCPEKKEKEFSPTQCIQCELNQTCKTVKSLEPQYPWMKYIQNI